MKKRKKTDLNLPVYYNTLEFFSDSKIERMESTVGKVKFPRVHIDRYNSKSFRVVNYHKHISRVFNEVLYFRDYK